jgi:O-succinylbenzoate synthase
MRYLFEFRPYRRSFKPPLQTSHGSWDVRDGIILSLTAETGTSSGEIAPISWFGSETLEQALDFCRQLPNAITDETIFSIPGDLPACQFGFESAWEGVVRGQETEDSQYLPSIDSLTYSGLLPAGKAALQAWQTLWNQGYRTFKWKIGVYPMPDEIEIFHALTQTLPASAKLRLDANGGLSYEDANYWLSTCDRRLPVEIEFIEQPLPVKQFEGMQELSYCYATPIALDESVATLQQLEACYQQGWRGIFVIKAAIAGSPKRLRQFCHEHKIDAVFSSVFETTVGRKAALKLAAELSPQNRAVGFGINHWLDEDET